MLNEYSAYRKIIEIIVKNLNTEKLILQEEQYDLVKNIINFVDNEKNILAVLSFIYLLPTEYYQSVDWYLLLEFYERVKNY